MVISQIPQIDFAEAEMNPDIKKAIGDKVKQYMRRAEQIKELVSQQKAKAEAQKQKQEPIKIEVSPAAAP